MENINILITGGTGFIGRPLIAELDNENYKLSIATRKISNYQKPNIKQINMGDLSPETDWEYALSNIDVVVHLAARVHVMNDTTSDPLVEFRKINTDATLNLAKQAASNNAQRFIFLSSIKVNGEATYPKQPFSFDDKYIPSDPYGLSKYQAEEGLKEIAAKTGMEVVIIRPPLVYGPNVKANFKSMMTWLYRGIPLPLGSIHNQRSLVSLDNLIDLIKTCITHPKAANQTFLISDGEDLSTTDLLYRMAKALDKPARLIPIPSSLLKIGATLLGKRGVADRLCGSLHVDINHTKKTLDWTPPMSTDEAIQKTAQAYKNEKTL